MSAPPRRRLVISDADLAAPPAAPPVNGASTYPSTSAYPRVGSPPAGSFAAAAAKRKLGDMTPGDMLDQVRNSSTLVTSVIAAAVAGLIAWAIFELVQDETPTHLVRQAALEFGVYTAVFAALFAAWDDITGQLWEKAARSAGIGLGVGAAAGAIAGAIAQDVYGHIVESILRSSGLDMSPTDIRLDLVRALGWGLLGIGIGAASGAARRSWRKTLNGTLGGALGGAIGGFLFNFIAQVTSSDTASRFIAFAVGSVLIGGAVGLIEIARRQAWVKVIGGGMTGKEFILYHRSTNFGSSPKCEITLIKDPAIGPYHFRIDEQSGHRSLTAFQGCVVTVNGAPVLSHRLRSGDVIGVGSSSLHYQERALPQGMAA